MSIPNANDQASHLPGPKANAAMSGQLLAGVELGGTKCVCILGTGPDAVIAQERIDTTDPETTLSGIERVLADWREVHGLPAALGIATFGPVELRHDSPRWGHITSTVKPGWPGAAVAPRLGRLLGVPVGLDTDVNGAALAEGRWGAARGLDDFAYITVGTGIGAGLVVDGRTVLGFTHPELGHIRVARAAGDDWHGSCAFHGDCIEGLASGTAIEARLGVAASRLDAEHPVWGLVVHGLAQLLHNIVLATAPKRILLGGGVMTAQTHLFPRLRAELQRSLAHYVDAEELQSGIEDFIVPPGLGAMAGPLGAMALAADAAKA